MFGNLLKAAALSALVLAPGAAFAATDAIVTTDLNMRSGPSVGYQRLTTIPGGDNVTVYGCVGDYDWCDVSWGGARGWVSSGYLAYIKSGRRRPVASVGVSIGLPIIGFDHDDYYRRHHSGWRHGDRDRGHHSDRNDRWDRDHDWNRNDRGYHRAERRELRQDRRDVKQARRELKQERRQLKRTRHQGGNVRAERRDVREARRDLRQERREVRRTRND